MMGISKGITGQIAKTYIKKYSLSSKELNKNLIQNINNSRNNSISTKKENIELLEVKSQANSEDNYNYYSRNALTIDINKLDNETSLNKSNKNLIKAINQPLLYDATMQVKNGDEPKKAMNSNTRYIIEKYDENCIDDSKIEYIECLLEEQNMNFFYFLLSIITLGIFALILEIYPILKVKFGYLRTHIYNASHFFIKGHDGKYYIKKAYEIKLPRLNNNNLANLTKLPVLSTQTKFFEFKLHKYVFNPEKNNFNSVTFKISPNANYEVISRKMIGGLSEEEINYQKIFIYKNKFINNVTSIKDMFEVEFSNPFYLVQLFCIIAFIILEYTLYCKVLIISTIIIVIFTFYETQSHIYFVNKLVSYSVDVNVRRKMKTINLNSDNLVPGDIVILPENDFILPCDLLLMTGTCIMNESFLSGESNPVFKSHIPKNGDKFNKNDTKFILYSGTKILQSKNEAVGLVIGVGFDTEKGKLIRNILFCEDKRELARKNKERHKIIIYLLIICFIGMLFPLRKILFSLELPKQKILLLFLELITNLLPSAITISIAIGIYVSFIRLKKQEISCLDRNKIDMAGNVDTICFDKTGTLTEDHLETYGSRIVNCSKKVITFGNFIDDLEEMSQKTLEFYMNNNNNNPKNKKEFLEDVEGLKYNLNGNNNNNNNNNNYFLKLGQTHQQKNMRLKLYFIEALASCNSLTKINGNIIGETIDLEMMKSTG